MNQPAQKAQASKARTAISPTRTENFPEWYQQVIKAADLAENSPVRGCMIIKPYGYAIWENVQKHLDRRIKEVDVQNAYFPLLIPVEFLSKEAEHIDGFAKECAVVTHTRLEKAPDGKLIPAAPLAEPYVIRPTSETIIGEALSNWVQSYRDLPYKLNQWCNVMRWEMRTRMFLRTSEFLWQEGHNCFASASEAHDDAIKMLNVYEDFLLHEMAIPGIKGEKTPEERFPGAINTYSYESMMQDGKALQSCTSHDLGQTFSRGANIQFQGEDGQQHFAHTTSWGLSTRTIGALIMTHSDDDGLIMPPRMASVHVAIIPVMKDTADAAVIEACQKLAARLKALGLKAHLDLSDDRTPNKMWAAIKKGIPVRVEIGAREVEQGVLTFVRRDQGKEFKKTVSTDEFLATVQLHLDQMQVDMLTKATKFQNDRIHTLNTLDDMRGFFSAETQGFVRIRSEEIVRPEFEKIRTDFSVTPRNKPFVDEGQYVLVGKSY